MAGYFVLTLLTLFLCKWTTPVLGCETKADCPKKDDGISTGALIGIIVGPIAFCLIIIFCPCVCRLKGTGSGTNYGGGGGGSNGGGDCGGSDCGDGGDCGGDGGD